MLLKRIVITAVVASLGLLTAACSDDAKDACEHAAEVCKGSANVQVSSDCSTANDKYDKLSDADKKKADDYIDCVMDADGCDGIAKCAQKLAGTNG